MVIADFTVDLQAEDNYTGVYVIFPSSQLYITRDMHETRKQQFSQYDCCGTINVTLRQKYEIKGY